MGEQDGDPELYVMNADGSKVQRITRRPGYDSHPAWSRDGKEIAFQSNRDGDYEIYVIRIDESFSAK
jgi:Tol biopolymer transport system component